MKCVNHRFFGLFEFHNPVYVIRDLDLIRQISIKDFDNFQNHRTKINEDSDSLFGKVLSMLRYQKWRDMRATLSPAYTGSKMRRMFSLIADISDDYMKELNRTIKTSQEIEFKDFANKYCNDVIAKCAFGVSVNSLVQPDNEFFKEGLYVTQFPLKQNIKFMGYFAFPKLMNVRPLYFFSSMIGDLLFKVP